MSGDEMEIDPAVAAAMGFSGFGMQNKKRKHGSEDTLAVTDSGPTDTASTADSQSNAKTGTVAGKQPIRSAVQSHGRAHTHEAVGPDGKPTLEALRHGVRNAQGDMAYFLPSFIEDPWKDLKPR